MIDEQTGDAPFEGLRDGIRFEAVCFAYGADEDDILKAVSFAIPAGKRTAIVGPSGAGKTTIVNLLLRLDEPSAGEILVDGQRLDTLRREDWLTRLAVAGQDVELMESTVRENIAVADSHASPASVSNAAKIAGLQPLIDELAEGMDHWIGNQGANFSGGQRQRLGLARALLRRPELLILDEATSALDAALEDAIQADLGRSRRGLTTVVITHRLTSVLHVDHLVVMKGGQVVEEGAPSVLLARGESHFSSMLAPFRAEHKSVASEHRDPIAFDKAAEAVTDGLGADGHGLP
ncbi:ABC transporter ATP-binding protein [Caulobacter endophyticus]|uniref:ABC transporter ATP-binding protein n=1 Tax=Caulobacter endophyticus TaxID=2172652 RepID=UPI0013050327|nr:ABC transporter ATP-binding protein [Caulobacter endophyticus]